MKSKLYKKISLFSLAAILFFSSCLKDDNYVDFGAVGTLIELPLSAFNPNSRGYKLVVQNYAAATAQGDLTVVVNIASPEPLSSNLDVTLAADPAALTTYNTANSTSFILLPASAYSVASPKITIPAGQRTGNIVFKINTAAVGTTIKNYVLPISITDASGQKISNYKTVYYNIRVN